MTVEDITDLIASTVKKLPPMQFTQIAQKLTSYHVYPTLFKNRGGKEMETRTGSGTCIPFTALVKTAGSAKNVLIYDTDTTNIADGLVEGEVPWRYSTFSYFFNQHEFEQNSGAKQLFNLIKDRREQALLDFADLLEGNYFGKPVDSTDKRTPWGLFYWLVKTTDTSSATSNCGFKGGAPSGFSDVGGINPTNYPMWKNYTAPYYSIKDWDNSGTTVKGDFINKLKRCIHYTNWISPLGGEELGKSFGKQFKLLTNFSVVSAIEEMLEDKNDLTFGADAGKMYGVTHFRGFPFFAIDTLDGATDDPLYGVNTSTFEMVFEPGFKMRENKPIQAPNQHNVLVTYVDCGYNWVCYDRRRNFVMNKVNTHAA